MDKSLINYLKQIPEHRDPHGLRHPLWLVLLIIIMGMMSGSWGKAKAAQYFTILNRIEYVITLDSKYSDRPFLAFWRKFNTLYNMIHRSDELKDAI